MKLQDITTCVTVPPTGIGGSFRVIVKVTTDDGIEGVGECYGIPFSGDVACRMVEDTFERFIAGEDPTEPGLGIELDERVLRDHPCTTGGRLHLEMCQTPLGSNNTKTVTELDG